MHEDDDDLHEPEHDHLLDHEFLDDDDSEDGEDAADALDDLDEPEVHEAAEDLLAFDDEERDHPAWFDDCDD
ncbi:hypothetical protein G7Z99_09470 [Pseudomonas entomophila]|uniref:hypothetical protein n=1 Tax=Pseudomonas entomophila TaxID=312306 RepID=UPI0015E2E3D2|nr:hypothetical protein [Pseudomonas entomophila]MBA1189281.1 hypothetical protein [Pseudomonas entomophila]